MVTYSEMHMKSAVKEAIALLNKKQVKYNTFDGRTSEMFAPTTLRDFTDNGDGTYEACLFTYDLKIGGEDDDDNNDSIMESSLQQNFISAMLDVNSDVEIVDWVGSEKGYWPVYLRFKSEAAKYSKRQGQIDMLNTKIKTAKIAIDEVNTNVAKRISTQTSKKKGCEHCGSSINISYIKTHHCPVCSVPMYTNGDKKKIEALENKIKAWETQKSSL